MTISVDGLGSFSRFQNLELVSHAVMHPQISHLCFERPRWGLLMADCVLIAIELLISISWCFLLTNHILLKLHGIAEFMC